MLDHTTETTVAPRRTKGVHNTEACMAFSRRLNAALDAAGLTQADLGRKLDVSRSAVNWWTTGKTYPSIDNANDLAALLGTTAAWLLFGAHAVESTKANVHVPIQGRGSDAFITLPLDFINKTKTNKHIHMQAYKVTGSNGHQIAVVNTDDHKLDDTPKMMVMKQRGAINVVKAHLSPNKTDCVIIEDDNHSTEMLFKPDMFYGRVSALVEAVHA